MYCKKTINILSKKNKEFYFSLFICLVFFILCTSIARVKLTYLEYFNIKGENETISSSIVIKSDSAGDKIIQQFIMPYDILNSIEIKMAPIRAGENSNWIFSIVERWKNKEYIKYKRSFNASFISNNMYTFKLNRNIRLKKGKIYEIHIIAKDTNKNNAIQFFHSPKKVQEGIELTFNEKPVEGTLFVVVYGGDSDGFWLNLSIFISFLFMWVIFRGLHCYTKNLSIKNDTIIYVPIIVLIVFCVTLIFSIEGRFIDEDDSIWGGITIANGGVLYRDYVTQHMPFSYYLCAFFSVLGAKSVEQFRILYYIFHGIMWSLLYLRHYKYYGKKEMLIFPVFISIFLPSVASRSHMILADGILGIWIVFILLDLIRFFEDNTIKLGRSIILSLFLVLGLSSIFLSIYTFFGISVVLMVRECIIIKNDSKLVSSYRKYILPSILIFIFILFFFGYFKLNQALQIAYDQFYAFNREIYPHYTRNYGGKYLQPIITGIQTYFGIFGYFNKLIVNGNFNYQQMMKLIIAILSLIVVYNIFNEQKYFAGISIILTIILLFPRGDGFHGMASWYVMLMTIIIFGYKFIRNISKIIKFFIILLIIYVSGDYINKASKNILLDHNIIRAIDAKIISITEENEKIFIDGWTSSDKIYLSYKKRFACNRVPYMLPWYMNWYENYTIDDLIKNMPNLVIYNENSEVWKRKNFNQEFVDTLKQHYKLVSPQIWIKK